MELQKLLNAYFSVSLLLFDIWLSLSLSLSRSLFLSVRFFILFQVLSFWSAIFIGTQIRENQSFNFTGCGTKY